MPEWKMSNNVFENPPGLNPILEAVITGDLAFLLAHLTRRNANSVDGVHRLPALHWALALGRLPTLRLLLARGASVFAVDGRGFSSLHRAVWAADADAVRALLFLDPLPPQTDEGGRKREDERGKKERGAAPTWRAGAHRLVNLPHAATGRTPLLLAALRGDLAIVGVLLRDCGAELSAVDHNGLSALDLAALCGHAELVAMLLRESELNHLRRIPSAGPASPHARLRQQAEDFCETARNLQQREQLNEINRLVCMPLAMQSFAASQ